MFGGTIRLQVADLVAEFLQFAAELIQFILERGDGIGTIVITGSLAFRTPGFGLEASDFRLGLGGHFLESCGLEKLCGLAQVLDFRSGGLTGAIRGMFVGLTFGWWWGLWMAVVPFLRGEVHGIHQEAGERGCAQDVRAEKSWCFHGSGMDCVQRGLGETPERS